MARPSKKAAQLQPDIPIKVGEKKGFYNVPDGPASNLILETLAAGDELSALPDRKKQVNHSQSVEVLEDGRRRQVTLSGSKSEVTIELADIDRLTGSNKAAKKLFVLSLIKANEQAIFDGQLTKEFISFPLQELVDIGFYSSQRSARTGFNSGMDALTSLKIKGRTQVSKKKGSSVDALEVLFTGARITNGQCTVYMNPRINWNFIAQYYTILPRYYFQLPNRASDLLYYIFYIARQHTKDLEERGYFTISFRAIQHRLRLPNELHTKNPMRDIKDPIDDALEKLEEAHSCLYGNAEFSLLPVCTDDASISDYLNNGYLKVSLSGEFAKAFIEISKDTKKQIETAQKRKEKIIDEAIKRNAAKKLEQEDPIAK